MESSQNLEIVGGVTKAVLYPTGTPLPEIGGEEECSAACTVSLTHSGSQYDEVWVAKNSSRVVKHTLTLVTYQDTPQFSAYRMKTALAQGVVADVTLASGAVIRVGEDTSDDGRYALRLKSVTSSSGEKPLDIPTITWVWESVDAKFEMGNY